MAPRHNRQRMSEQSTTVTEWQCVKCHERWTGAYPSIAGTCTRVDLQLSTSANHLWAPYKSGGDPWASPMAARANTYLKRIGYAGTHPTGFEDLVRLLEEVGGATCEHPIELLTLFQLQSGAHLHWCRGCGATQTKSDPWEKPRRT